MKADKMTMRNSLELRVPFLDHALVEWAARAPLEVKVGDAASGWSSKRVLREFAREPGPARDRRAAEAGLPGARRTTGSPGRSRAGRGTGSRRRAARRAIRPSARSPGSTLDAACRRPSAAAQRVWTLIVLARVARALGLRRTMRVCLLSYASPAALPAGDPGRPPRPPQRARAARGGRRRRGPGGDEGLRCDAAPAGCPVRRLPWGGARALARALRDRTLKDRALVPDQFPPVGPGGGPAPDRGEAPLGRRRRPRHLRPADVRPPGRPARSRSAPARAGSPTSATRGRTALSAGADRVAARGQPRFRRPDVVADCRPPRLHLRRDRELVMREYARRPAEKATVLPHAFDPALYPEPSPGR